MQTRATCAEKCFAQGKKREGFYNFLFLLILAEPEKLVHHILKDMHVTKKKKTRVILRMLPVSGTCKAFLEDMKQYSETFFEPWFKAPHKGTFQIVYKARNNSHLKREEVIKELAGIDQLEYQCKGALRNNVLPPHQTYKMGWYFSAHLIIEIA